MRKLSNMHPSLLSLVKSHWHKCRLLNLTLRMTQGAVEMVCSPCCRAMSYSRNQQTTSTLIAFTLAMVKNPWIWRCAQAEIDATLGTDRLPEYEDRPSLPYVDAILQEVFRWNPVAPLGESSETSHFRYILMHLEAVPHATISDDIYKGYYIPNGTSWKTYVNLTCGDIFPTGATIYANLWCR